MACAGGVVLAGGRSRRMGSSKAALEWHGSTLLRHVTGIVGRAVDGPVLVVAAAGQVLPELPAGVTVLRDPAEGRGPLQGIAVGLAALAGRVDVAFVCATDLPHLHHRLVSTLVDRLRLDDRVEAAVPVRGGHPQPLVAAYSTRLAATATELLSAGRLRAGELAAAVPSAWLDESALLRDAALAGVDPTLTSLADVDSPEAYRAARAEPPPLVVVLQEDSENVRAATLSAALAAVGRALDYQVVPLIDGVPVARDEHFPLCAGDRLALITVAGAAPSASGRLS